LIILKEYLEQLLVQQFITILLGTSEACDRNPMQTFADVANRLNIFGLAYLHIIDRKVVVTSYLPVGVARHRHPFTGGNQTAPP
jgi:hypothetical protein